MSHFSLPRLSRRALLASGLAAAGLSTLGLKRGFAAGAPLTVGDHEVTVFSDGNLSLPMGFILPDRSEAEIGALLSPHGMALDVLTPDCNVTMTRVGERLVLFDTGSGSNFQPTAGDLVAGLEDAGVDPADITDVVFTHAHPDHLWGVLDEFDDPLFSEAAFWVPQAEWDYWLADDTLDKTPEERKTFVVGAQSRFDAISDRVNMIAPGMEVAPGIEAVETSGHTPGHMSYMIHGSGDGLMILGDAISNAVISFEKPDWRYGSDQDPDKAIQTRLALLDRLASDKTKIVGYHLPHPGVGYVEKTGSSAFRFVVEG